ncbi:MAG: hypothetical protein ACLP50_22895 [Solirubrobacteraceae bacterium]
MSSVVATSSSAVREDPARRRGLRRARSPAPLPEVAATVMPAAVDAVHLLALLTRVRARRVADGELGEGRLYDVRAFKTSYAELGYLRRLAAAGRHGGTVITSMRQLVAGLAVLHPAWKLTDDGFENRDRHHQAVRRRLRALAEMGLLRWRVGLDLDGEERRTELELQDPPAVSAEELQAAASVLARWQARYGAALNTGSRTGVRNAAGHGRPLSASERQRRGARHARAAAASRPRCDQKSNSTPPFGASATPQREQLDDRNVSGIRNACQRTRVTRTNVSQPPSESAAPERAVKDRTPGIEESRVEGSLASVGGAVGVPEVVGGAVWDPEALIARVKAREALRAPLLAAIAADAQARAVELAGWGLERGWPSSRLREAWVVARYGALAAADSGPAGAGPLDGEDYARCRRAVARYERNRSAAPEGYPAGGLAALLHLGALAADAQLPNAPRTLRYAIGALDQLARRMRALATAQSTQRQQAAAGRAARRRDPASRASKLAFRTPGWPAWILTPGHQQPRFDERGVLVLDERNITLAPGPDTSAYRTVIRDAYLLAGHPLPLDMDGRWQMALRHAGQLEPARRRERPGIEELELRELAHRTGEPISLLRRISPVYRQAWLQHQRQHDAAQARAQTAAFRRALAELHDHPE